MSGLLEVQKLDAGYGDIEILHGIEISVAKSEIVAVVGANGAGKTTLLSALSGIISPRSGAVVFDGEDVTALRADLKLRKGLALVPEGGRLFPFMTVEENLQLGAFTPSARADLSRRLSEVVGLFPRLDERRKQLAGQLSGGERQMCAIARALMSNPRLLMLDEPSVGLSPVMVDQVLDVVVALARDKAMSILIVEQNVNEVLDISNRAYVIDHGRITKSGLSKDLRDDRQIQETYMGL